MAKRITFLDLDEVLEIHQDQIRRYGGDSFVRDLGLLQSAVAMPQAAFGGQYLHQYPHEMGAAYLFHLVQNHPFVDGNKRTGLATTLIFLKLNRLKLKASKSQVEHLVLGVASGQASKKIVSKFFAAHISR